MAESKVPVVPCAFVPRGIVLPSSLDGRCPACGKLISDHEGVTTVLTFPGPGRRSERMTPTRDLLMREKGQEDATARLYRRLITRLIREASAELLPENWQRVRAAALAELGPEGES